MRIKIPPPPAQTSAPAPGLPPPKPSRSHSLTLRVDAHCDEAINKRAQALGCTRSAAAEDLIYHGVAQALDPSGIPESLAQCAAGLERLAAQLRAPPPAGDTPASADQQHSRTQMAKELAYCAQILQGAVATLGFASYPDLAQLRSLSSWLVAEAARREREAEAQRDVQRGDEQRQIAAGMRALHQLLWQLGLNELVGRVAAEARATGGKPPLD